LIENNSNNLDQKQKDALRGLQQQASQGKSPQELIEAFKEIDTIISTRTAESNKSQTDQAQKDATENKDKAKDKLQEFIDEFKRLMQENDRLEQKKMQDARDKRAENEQKRQQIQTAELDSVGIE
jgi:hypothetical protein